MKRMAGSGPGPTSGNMSGNMSYTNLAAMAESFEVGARLIPSAAKAGASSTSAAEPAKLYVQAQELINTGCQPPPPSHAAARARALCRAARSVRRGRCSCCCTAQSSRAMSRAGGS